MDTASFPAGRPSLKVMRGSAGRASGTVFLRLPLPRDGDPTLVPTHIVVGGSKTYVAKADWLLAVLAIVAWKVKKRERKKMYP